MSVAAQGHGSAARSSTAWSGPSRVDSRDDVARALAEVTAAGRRRDRTTAMGHVVERASTGLLDEPDAAKVLPLVDELLTLSPWPGGLRRGSTVVATGSRSLVYALLAEPMAQGAWAAVVGMPELSAGPAAEYGIDLGRLAFVPQPGEQWASIIAALIDGFDLVVVTTQAEVPAGTARSLMARARQRGTVLIPTRTWPGSDLTLEVVDRRWTGVRSGRGRLRRHEVTVSAAGRGRAGRARRVTTLFPPASVSERVGPLPGQVPAVPAELVAAADRVRAARPSTPRPVLVDRVEPDDPWQVIARAGQRRAG